MAADVSIEDALYKVIQEYDNKKIQDLSKFLWLFKVRGEPCDLNNHFIFTPAYYTEQPKRSTWKIARQMGKTTNAISLPYLLRSILVSNWTSLVVAPRFEQSKRISTDFTDKFINSSDFKDVIKDSDSRQSVLSKTFPTGSIQYYSYAYLDCERIRGIPGVDSWAIDEVQDMNIDFIPIIRETATASPYGFETFCGTPLTMDSSLEKLWVEGTQSEYIIKCEHCNKYNIPSAEFDLLNMIGKHTVICCGCGKNLNVRNGQWVARFPERMGDMVSRHLPQIINPIHCENESKWAELLYKVNNYTKGKLYNEVFGESWDTADKLYSETDIKRACRGIDISLKTAKKRASQLKNVCMGVDWTGGGIGSDSYTSIVVGGLVPGTNDIEIVYSEKLAKVSNPQQECKYVIGLMNRFNCQYIAHDYGGVGRGLEFLLLQMGVPQKKLIPFSYVISHKKDIVSIDGIDGGHRRCYNLDKIRSLVVLSTMFKTGRIILPSWNSLESMGRAMNPFRDLLSLFIEQKESLKGSDFFYIKRSANQPDDTAHALNLLCTSIWYKQGSYPSVAEASQYLMTEEQIQAAWPEDIG